MLTSEASIGKAPTQKRTADSRKQKYTSTLSVSAFYFNFPGFCFLLSRCFQDFHELRKKLLPGELRGERRAFLPARSNSAFLQPQNVLNNLGNIAVACPAKGQSAVDLHENFRNVTRLGANIQNRRTNPQDVVNLARMHQPDKPITHHHH